MGSNFIFVLIEAMIAALLVPAVSGVQKESDKSLEKGKTLHSSRYFR
jgi:hypothetical protein